MTQLRVTTVCSSTSWAGTEKWALRASEELAKQGHRVTFVGRAPDIFRAHQREASVTHLKLPFLNDWDPITLFRLAFHLKRNADVVIVTRVRDYWLGGLAAQIANVPVLLRLGVVRKLRKNHWRDRMRYGKFPSAIMVNATAICNALSETSWIDPGKIHVIYNGVDTPGPMDEAERLSFRRRQNVPDGSVLLVGAGRLAVEKRWDWLINAASDLIQKNISVDARILGEGNERGPLEERLRALPERVSSSIRLMGRRNDADQWLGAADIAVLPSNNEGISNTMLEAMGQATPVVATASGGVREVFVDKKHLMLADTEDYQMFTSYIKLLATSQDLRLSLGLSGFERSSEVFRWEAMAEQLEQLLAHLAETKR